MYCIYKITNLVNGKTYIGQHKYKNLYDSYMGSGKHLKRAQKKYGIENFEKEIIYSRIQYKETADDMERFAIAKERSIGKAEYNIADGGQGGGIKGTKLSEETKRKISESLKGNKNGCGKHSEEHNKKISDALKRKSLSEETRRKLSEAHKGKKRGPMSEEQKRKISESRKGKGKPRTDETKQKISEALKGNTHALGTKHNRSEEYRKKMSEAKKKYYREKNLLKTNI